MKIQHVERFTVPIERAWEGRVDLGLPAGTTVEELIRALRKLPKKGIVHTDFNTGNLTVMHHKPDIDPECPYEIALTAALNEMAQATYIPLQYINQE
ncbi:hypothetical protein SEA_EXPLOSIONERVOSA_46 [Mycobacterium phage ExplosioNervosa]|uniref:Uncharacterized protein n=1 Tax=Mycobacterium phage Conquerage TaxID=2081622 RepID=A0A2P1A117_9CAUD|nr:hypothetical protein AVV05_gp063 [Mycobacterium phage Pioneer]AVI03755.1 hypothetical protein SEA_CONQUERAGE_46 [Mycobacterium phage Conquerage]AVI04252.1 hypothetical protein SEA_PHONNEGUT_46 [Mycobacterium phage Phonnegut]AVI04364.1 hypothetical protein SEA_SCHERZO_46 [Mycobacterium phage Scherzo]AZF93523.1 hypothetical protein SEA_EXPLOSIONERVOSA_46 [Mycobacterium phage ExplosioNervosa]QBI96363.1 hypothetical protein SEA_UGENIE5_43 [Mycobacterium phage Ugenie5]QGJ88697.1 hypothetical pr